MKLDEIKLTEILKDVLEHGEKIQRVIENLERKLEDKDNQIKALIEENRKQVASFEHKYKTIEVKAPQPDLSEVNMVLSKGFVTVSQAIDKGPKSIVRQIRFTLFPEQMRTPEYYQVMMRWLVWIILGSLGMVLSYMLLNKHV